MSSVCLSLVANLRCTGLRPQQAIGVLVPPIVEVVLILPLVYSQREQGRSHYLLIFESLFYLALCILDFVSKSTDSIANSLRTFSVVDRLIGGLSAIPILLYTIFLYILAKRFFVPIIPTRFHSGVKVLLLILIPTILALVEFGSLIGITYAVVEKPTRELAIRFESNLAKTVWMLFGSAGLAIFILYQFITFLLACFRTFRHFIQNSSSTFAVTRSEREKAKRGRSLRGLGWLLAGIKLGAIEVLLGYIPSGFEQSLSRRLVRLLARAMLAWGVYKGVDESASLTMFRVGSIDSFESLPPRKIPVDPGVIRSRIGAPLTDTFAKMSPTATSFHTRKKAPDAMRGISTFDVSFVDEKGIGPSTSPQPGPSRLRYAANAETLPTTIVPAMVAQSIVSPVTSNATFPKQTVEKRPELRTRSRSSPGLDGKRVTVTYDGLAAPVLDVRFSAQVLGDAGKLIKRVGKEESSSSSVESSSEETVSRPTLSRSKSSPYIMSTANAVGPSSVQRLPLATTAMSSSSSQLLTRTTASKPSSRSRSRSLSAKSATTPTSELRNPFADSYDVLLPSSQESGNPRQQRLGSSDSTEDSLLAVHRLSRKFPPIPANALTAPMPPTVSSPSDESPTKSSSKRKPPPSLATLTTSGNDRVTSVSKQGGRPRSLSQPNPAVPQHRSIMPEMTETPLPVKHHASGELSPAASLDQDVAMRTRRRIRNHLSNVSPRVSVADGDGANGGGQWVAIPPQPPFSGRKGHRYSKSLGSVANRTATTANTPLTPFSGPLTTPISRAETKATSIMSHGERQLEKDDMVSPSTIYTRESIYTTDEEDGAYTAPLPVERPLGRIARRALGIEQFLDEERERSQDGHVEVQAHTKIPSNVPVDVEDISEYRASNIVFTPPSTTRRRPRSDIDTVPRSIPLPSKQARRQQERKQETIVEEPETPLRRSLTSVEDPETRKAFALAWKHAVPNANVASPKAAAGLRTINSVRAKTTPTPVHHRKVLSGQSMKIDEGHMESLDALVASPLPISPSPMAGFGRMKGSTFVLANDDRESVKRSRKAHDMSVDSEVY